MKLDMLVPAIISLVLVFIIGGALSLAQLGLSEDIESDLNSATATNESVTWVNNTYVGLANSDTLRSCDTVWNGTGGITIGSGNYSCADNQGISFVDDGTLFPSTTLLVTYTYGARDVAYNVTQTGMESLDNVTAFGDVWGTIIGVAVLITIVIGAFAFGRRL